MINHLFSVQLTLIGITFSIFTILYSLIVGKIDQLKIISRQIKEGCVNPDIKQAEIFCLRSLSRLKRTNIYVITICCISIALSIILFFSDTLSKSSLLYLLIIILNALDFISIITLIIVLFISYHKETKID